MSLKENNRISILKEEGLFSLVILPEREKWKVNLLFFWLVCWTVCGIIFIANYFNYSNRASAGRVNYNAIYNIPQKDYKQKQQTLAEIEKKINLFDRQRTVLLVVICFWLYYEYRVSRAYTYRKFGHEKLWIKNGKLYFRKEINRRSKTKVYDIEFVKDFRLLEYNKNEFFQSMSRSFWTMAGESIAFDFHSKIIRFGIQLSEKESKQICEELAKAHKKALAKIESGA
ncbi:MAG: hypothetical protein IAF38_21045 [Bacteroidia bacterium]|nr:hypothetical protein [Bacteroidia bacterium]